MLPTFGWGTGRKSPRKQPAGKSRRQRIISGLAGNPCGSRGVGVFSNVSYSLVNPIEHVGKQISGGAGCRACTGRGGMAGACTAGAGKGGDTLAHPLASRGSSSSIGARTRQVRFSFTDSPLQRGGAALFFGPGVLFGLAGGPFKPSELFGVPGAGRGVAGLLGSQAVGLDDSEAGQRQDYDCDERAHHHRLPAARQVSRRSRLR